MKIQWLGQSIWACAPDGSFSLEFANFKDTHDGCTAEVTASEVATNLTYWARLNLASAAARSSYAKASLEVLPNLPLRVWLDKACHEAMKLRRIGDPAEEIIAEASLPTPWFLDGFIPLNQTTVLYAEGDSLKSYFCLSLLASALKGVDFARRYPIPLIKSAMWLDWETDKPTFKGRLWSVQCLLGDGEPVRGLHYKKMVAPLAESLPAVLREMAEHRCEFVVLDSCTPAAGPDAEFSDAAMRLLASIRQMDCTALLVAHTAKAAPGTEQTKPYGSAFYHYLPRGGIQAFRQESDDPYRATVTYKSTKHNNGPAVSPFALEYVFDQATRYVAVTTADPDPVALGLPAQIWNLLGRGRQTATSMAKEIGANPATVRRLLDRWEKRDKVVRLTETRGGRGHEVEWGRVLTNRDMESM